MSYTGQGMKVDNETAEAVTWKSVVSATGPEIGSISTVKEPFATLNFQSLFVSEPFPSSTFEGTPVWAAGAVFNVTGFSAKPMGSQHFPGYITGNADLTNLDPITGAYDISNVNVVATLSPQLM